MFKFCRTGFQHVRAFKKQANVWISINPQISHIDIALYREEMTLEQICGKGCTIVKYCTNINPVQINSSFGYNTCIDTVKRLIGMRGIIFTPHQLYLRLQNELAK
jgi:hypothetical protein